MVAILHLLEVSFWHTANVFHRSTLPVHKLWFFDYLDLFGKTYFMNFNLQNSIVYFYQPNFIDDQPSYRISYDI